MRSAHPLLASATSSNVTATTTTVTAASAIDEGPVTTTKALLVQIVAPRKFTAHKELPKYDDDDETTTLRDDSEADPADHRSVPPTHSDRTVRTAGDVQDNDNNNNNNNNNSSNNNGSHTETIPDDDDDDTDTDHDAPPFCSATAPPLPGRVEEMMREDSGAAASGGRLSLSNGGGGGGDTVINMGSQEITPEEAAAIEQVHSSENALINVEELLRITFHRMAEEYHLLNIPTYTMVRHLTVVPEATANNNDSDEESDSEGINYTIDDRVVKPSSSIVEDADVSSGQKRSNTTSSTDSDQDDSSQPTKNDQYEWIQVNVMVRPASLGIVLDRLERIGVGTNCGTLTVLSAELCRTASPLAHMPPVVSDENDSDDSNDQDKTTAPSSSADPKLSHRSAAQTLSVEKSPLQGTAADTEVLAKERAIEAARAEWKNAATRLRIEQVREQIVEQAAWSFDFIALLVVASILAGVGLITDNTVVIVASMLVSPIMGPVLGVTFGTRIRDGPLVVSSLRHECLALLGCVITGALIALGAAFTNLAQEEWPTTEMRIRGEPTGLLTGLAIAIPSGMGVCLSILGGNTSSLVGVAISASLLPPAVNTGVCLVYAFFLAVGAVEPGVPEDGEVQGAAEFMVIGGISFALTILNIVCIWLAGLVMFEIKEVAPTEKKSAFWAKDIKVARELNSTQEKPAPVNLGVLRLGLKSALNKKAGPKVDQVRLKFANKKKQHHKSHSVGTAFAHRVPEMNQKRGHRPTVSNVSYTEYEEVDENVRFVGLEDMAGLLGFDDEDEDLAIDHAAVARRLGRGRYL